MRRFFIEPFEHAEPGQTVVFLDRDESHHLMRVVRLQVGNRIELFDGSGALYTGEIETLGKEVAVRLLSSQPQVDVSSIQLHVCQGDLKGSKMDFLVEKCTELGVAQFTPFFSSRSQGRVQPQRWEQKRQRWQARIRSACKQSGRLRFMGLGREQEFTDLLGGKDQNPGTRIILSEYETTTRLGDVLQDAFNQPIWLMLGPEGGFSEAEVDQARSGGWQPVSLGSRILRAETATVAAVAICQHLLGAM
jgi:16S rRNA (uracil1498-N3)-methyltransferase